MFSFKGNTNMRKKIYYYFEYDGIDIKKFIVVLLNLIALIFAIRWLCTEWVGDYFEPLISILGICVFLVLDGKFWKSNFYFKLEKKLGLDDNYIDPILLLPQWNHDILIKPNAKTKYWRCGLKFSEDFNIPLQRLSKGYPLFHLTQSNIPILSVDFINEQNFKIISEEHIKKPYEAQPITIKLRRTVNENVIHIYHQAVCIFNYTIEKKYLYCRLFAWADGEEFDITIIINKDQNKNQI